MMIKRNMRADLAARNSAALKLPGTINYVNFGWGPCEAPTYAGEYTREELHGEVIERPQLDGNQRLEKGLRVTGSQTKKTKTQQSNEHRTNTHAAVIASNHLL